MRKSVLVLIMAACLLSGCATAGRSKFSNAESFAKENNFIGMRVEEVVTALGEPELRYVSEGNDVMEYRYVSVYNNVISYPPLVGLFFSADRYNMNYLYLTIGKDGKVSAQDAFHKTDDFPKRNILF